MYINSGSCGGGGDVYMNDPYLLSFQFSLTLRKFLHIILYFDIYEVYLYYILRC